MVSPIYSENEDARRQAQRSLTTRIPGTFSEMADAGMIEYDMTDVFNFITKGKRDYESERDEIIRKIAKKEGVEVPERPIAHLFKTGVTGDITKEFIDDMAFRFPGVILTDEQIIQKLSAAAKEKQKEIGEILSVSGWDAKLGYFTGGIFGATALNPINLASMLIGWGETTSILQIAAREAGINMASEALQQPLTYYKMKELGLEYGVEDAFMNIAAAGVGGAVVGPALQKGLPPAILLASKAYTRLDDALIEGAQYIQRGIRHWRHPGSKALDEILDGVADGISRGILPDNPKLIAAYKQIDEMSDIINNSPHLPSDPEGDMKYLRNLARATQKYDEGGIRVGPDDEAPIRPDLKPTPDEVLAQENFEARLRRESSVEQRLEGMLTEGLQGFTGSGFRQAIRYLGSERLNVILPLIEGLRPKVGATLADRVFKRGVEKAIDNVKKGVAAPAYRSPGDPTFLQETRKMGAEAEEMVDMIEKNLLDKNIKKNLDLVEGRVKGLLGEKEVNLAIRRLDDEGKEFIETVNAKQALDLADDDLLSVERMKRCYVEFK